MGPDVIFDVQPPLRGEREDSSTGELLADGGDAERCAGPDRHAEFDVREPRTAVNAQDIVADDANRDPGATGVLPWTQKTFHDALKTQSGQVGHARYPGFTR